jgi:hypothetical protein
MNFVFGKSKGTIPEWKELYFKIDLGLSFMALDLTYKVPMREPTDGWKWVKFKAIHDKLINMCSKSWYNYSFWFSLLPWIPNSVRMTRLSSPNTHQSLYIASDNTIYMILGHSDCNIFTMVNNKKSTVYFLKLLHLKFEN